jgi:Crp-like helix-turn-helix domain
LRELRGRGDVGRGSIPPSLAIAGLPDGGAAFARVDDRLLATLWHLASMWGRVIPQGTVVPFRLTHEMLASIVGAQRPTTTVAIHSLVQQRRLARDERPD